MEDTRIFEEILRLKKERQPAVLATLVECTGSAPRKAGAKMLIRGDGSLLGTVGGGPLEHQVRTAATEMPRGSAPRTLSFTLDEQSGAVCGGRVLVYLEPVTVPPRLLVVGDGHVAQAVERLSAECGFQALSVTPDSDEEEGGFALCDEDTFVLIATREHQLDFRAARCALQTPAAFIGLLGSRRKRLALESYLKAEGHSVDSIDRIVSPVGLPIGACTPGEIAISILGQIIEHRRIHGGTALGHCAGGRALPEDGKVQAASSPR